MYNVDETTLKILQENRGERELTDINPHKLAFAHEHLFGLPSEIWLQIPGEVAIQNFNDAVALLSTMVSTQGIEGWPVPPRKVVRRHVGHWSFHLRLKGWSYMNGRPERDPALVEYDHRAVLDRTLDGEWSLHVEPRHHATSTTLIDHRVGSTGATIEDVFDEVKMFLNKLTEKSRTSCLERQERDRKIEEERNK